jgi:hypothetical protein
MGQSHEAGIVRQRRGSRHMGAGAGALTLGKHGGGWAARVRKFELAGSARILSRVQRRRGRAVSRG